MLIQTPKCVECGERSTLSVPYDGFESWQKGAKIQHAFPNMPADQRELLISGTHPECWEKLFATEEEEEELDG